MFQELLKVTEINFTEGNLEILLGENDYWVAIEKGLAHLGRYDGENKIILISDENMHHSDLHLVEINALSGDIILRIPKDALTLVYTWFGFSEKLGQIKYVEGENTNFITNVDLFPYGIKYNRN